MQDFKTAGVSFKPEWLQILFVFLGCSQVERFLGTRVISGGLTHLSDLSPFNFLYVELYNLLYSQAEPRVPGTREALK